MWFYFILFLLIFLSCFLKEKWKNILLYFFLILLFLVAGLRGFDVDQDIKNYKSAFDHITKDSNFFEPSFFIITSIARTFHLSITWLLLFYAVVGVSIKFYSINQLTEFFFFSLLVYFSYFFFLHEMTQIRAGVASGLVLLSIKYIHKKNYYKFFFIVLVATFFHYSSLVLLPFIFLNAKHINKFYYFLIPIAYIFYFTHFQTISLLSLINFTPIATKIEIYNKIAKVNQINVFNIVHLIHCILAYLFLYKSNLLITKNKYSILLIKFYLISCFFFVFFADIPALAFRLNELVGIVEVLLIPFLIYLFKDKILGKFLVVLYSLSILLLQLFYSHLVNSYF